jgi:hypothetical protein
MPVRALRYVDADHVVPLDEIAGLLKREVLRTRKTCKTRRS